MLSKAEREELEDLSIRLHRVEQDTEVMLNTLDCQRLAVKVGRTKVRKLLGETIPDEAPQPKRAASTTAQPWEAP